MGPIKNAIESNPANANLRCGGRATRRSRTDRRQCRNDVDESSIRLADARGGPWQYVFNDAI